MAEYNTTLENQDALPIPYAMILEDGRVHVDNLYKERPIHCMSDHMTFDGSQMQIRNTASKAYILIGPDKQLIIKRK